MGTCFCKKKQVIRRKKLSQEEIIEQAYEYNRIYIQYFKTLTDKKSSAF